jgi:hypothetical protein
MCTSHLKRTALSAVVFLSTLSGLLAQGNAQLKLTDARIIYGGIEVGSKGVKMSVLEVGNNAQTGNSFTILKDTSVNTDFITFSQPTFQATLNGICSLYAVATKEYKIPTDKIFTVISSGVQMQAEKENKKVWVNNFIDSFKVKIKEPKRKVEVVDVLQEGRLSHLGIVPESKRYTTFLIDIGSGNTKGGYFPYGNTDNFKLFQLNWGTKSVANATEQRCDEFDKTLANYNKQMYRVLAAAENQDIMYAVNASGAYTMNDYIAFSGGIAWAASTLSHPELADNPVVTVTYEEIEKLSEALLKNYASLSDVALLKNVKNGTLDKTAAAAEIKRIHKVFDQRSLMAGTGLLLKIMRQFKSVYETKQFYLVKNGQVGWISAYVDQQTDGK